MHECQNLKGIRALTNPDSSQDHADFLKTEVVEFIFGTSPQTHYDEDFESDPKDRAYASVESQKTFHE